MQLYQILKNNYCEFLFTNYYIISRGQDLPDAATLFHALVNTGTSVKLFLVHDSDVNEFSSKVPDNLLSVPGTMTIYLLVTHEPYKIASELGVVYVKMA